MKRPTPWVTAIVLDRDGKVWVGPEGLPGGAVRGGQSWAEAADELVPAYPGEWVLAGLYSRPDTQVRGGHHRMEVVLGRVVPASLGSTGVSPAELSSVERDRVERWMAGEIGVD